MNIFHCKKFSVIQEQSAMKIGTDSMILGAWANFESAKNMLDIGTGTGILSLMSAQRFPDLLIDAVEIDESAFAEAKTNFENSPWTNRLNPYHTSIQEFTIDKTQYYDAIICNPPYFAPHEIQSLSSRNMARQTHLLNHITLLQIAKKLLKRNGICVFSIPFTQESFFIALAHNYGLFPNRILQMKDKTASEITRSFIILSFKSLEIEEQQIVLKNSDNAYTENFKNLTRDFYTIF